jgi:hypothetical protein
MKKPKKNLLFEPAVKNKYEHGILNNYRIHFLHKLNILLQFSLTEVMEIIPLL